MEGKPVASASASVPDLALRGLKRVCAGCGTRFYDLNKRPVVCPNCKVEFSSDAKARVRRGRAVPEAAVVDAKPAPEEEGIEILAREDDLVSLEDVEESTDDDEDLDESEGDLELDDTDDLEGEIDVDLDEEK